MSEQTIEEIYAKMDSFIATGDDAGAQEYLAQEFPNLPPELQNEIVTLTFMKELTDEAVLRETVASIQEQGLVAAEMLQKVRTERQAETETES